MYRPTTATIHLQHLSHNLSEIRTLLGPRGFLCPMVKANAYGHGDIAIARRLEDDGVEHMGVGLVEEGMILREGGITAKILVFGTFDRSGAEMIVNHNLTAVVSSWRELQILESSAQTPIQIHVKFDTGMHRLGFDVEDAGKLFQKLKSHRLIKLKGILTHLHSAEDFTNLQGQSFTQLARFQPVIEVFKSMKLRVHTLNSAGLLLFSQVRADQFPNGITLPQGARPGLCLYGVSPVSTKVTLKPVMSLRSSVVRLQKIKTGDGVSYGHTWKAKRDSVVAVIPIGYADGYHRILTNKAEVLFKGRRVPQVGNVCMDYTMIDVTDVVGNQNFDPFLQEEVTLFGYDSENHLLNATELAKWAGTIPWEILTSVGERVPRQIVE